MRDLRRVSGAHLTGNFEAVVDFDETVKQVGKVIGREITANLIEAQVTATWENVVGRLPFSLETERLVLAHRLIPSVADEIFDGLLPEHFYQPWHAKMAELMLPPAPPLPLHELAAALDACTPYQSKRWSKLLVYLEDEVPALSEPDKVRDAVVRLRRLHGRRTQICQLDALAADLRGSDLDDVQNLDRLRAVAAIVKGQPTK